MMKRVEYEITVKGILIPWAIRTYLHNKGYILLILITKAVGLYSIFNIQVFGFNFQTVLAFFLFFYFEGFILYRYFFFKNRINKLLGTNRTSSIDFLEEGVLFKDTNSESLVKISEVDRVKETRFFIFAYKGKLKIMAFYKGNFTSEDLGVIRDYFSKFLA